LKTDEDLLTAKTFR